MYMFAALGGAGLVMDQIRRREEEEARARREADLRRAELNHEEKKRNRKEDK